MSPNNSEIPRIRVDLLDLSRRTLNILLNSGYIYFDELPNLSTKIFLNLQGAGRKSLNEIRALLATHNLCLSDESTCEDVKQMITVNIPAEIDKIKEKIDSLHAQITDALKDLKYLSYKLEDFCKKSKRKSNE